MEIVDEFNKVLNEESEEDQPRIIATFKPQKGLLVTGVQFNIRRNDIVHLKISAINETTMTPWEGQIWIACLHTSPSFREEIITSFHIDMSEVPFQLSSSLNTRAIMALRLPNISKLVPGYLTDVPELGNIDLRFPMVSSDEHNQGLAAESRQWEIIIIPMDPNFLTTESLEVPDRLLKGRARIPIQIVAVLRPETNLKKPKRPTAHLDFPHIFTRNQRAIDECLTNYYRYLVNLSPAKLEIELCRSASYHKHNPKSRQ
jgi:hypothetical protein